ncbi:MAG TPA: hypothetical protein DEB56_13645 [Thiobacillus sp.]|nr:hypothetical protein [Thiobacillus sp.]
MDKKAKEILKKPYARRLVPDEEGGFVASIHEFPGCFAEGETPDEALHNLDEAAAAWIESAMATGYPVREPVSFFGYSGKIALRIPRGLHKQLAELAELEDSSINQLLVTAISGYVSTGHALSKLSETVRSEVRKIVTDGLVSLSRNGPTSFTFSIQSSQVPMHYVGGSSMAGITAETTISIPNPLRQPALLEHAP